MPVKRTLPPAAAPLEMRDILTAVQGLVHGDQEIARFESELQEYFGRRHCILVSSGKAALFLILQALKAQNPGRDEVIIPAFTCFSVPAAIVRAGLKLRLCDLDPQTLDYDYGQLRQQLRHQPQASKPAAPAGEHHPCGRQKLLAVIAAHLFGYPAGIQQVRELASDPGVVIIEDAAQAMGGEGEGGKLGTLGDVSIMSLGRGKAFSTLEGGVILTDRDELAAMVRQRLAASPPWTKRQQFSLAMQALLLLFFQHPLVFWLPKLLPFLKLGETIYRPDFEVKKITAFQAGLARNWRQKLKSFQEVRQRHARYLHERLGSLFQSYGGCGRGLPALVRFPLLLKDKETKARILKISQAQGFGIMPSYPAPVHEIEALKKIFQGQQYPGAKRVSELLVTIPVHPFVKAKDTSRIVKALLSIQQPHNASPTVSRPDEQSLLAVQDGLDSG